MAQLVTRLSKIRKNYLTFITTHSMMLKEADSKKKIQMRIKCSKIQLNSELLLNLANDLSEYEKTMLIRIKDKTLPPVKEIL